MGERSQIILQILCSLNQGDSGNTTERVYTAIRQYNTLVSYGIIAGPKISL